MIRPDDRIQPKIGSRRHRADVLRHNGSTDADGIPDYTSPSTWDTVITGWPCQILTSSNGEPVRGRQVTRETTHVFYGAFTGGNKITTDMRVQVEGVTYEVIASIDPYNDRRMWWVEAKVQT